MITDDDRFVEYTIVQHPSLPKNGVRKWKPRDSKKKVPLKDASLDKWLK